jgi:hypothetical protein
LDITSLVYAEATVITETMGENSKRGKNERNKNFCMIGLTRKMSNWKKKCERSVLAEMGTGSNNGKFNGKTDENIKKHKVTNIREVVLLAETVKQKM